MSDPTDRYVVLAGAAALALLAGAAPAQSPPAPDFAADPVPGLNFYGVPGLIDTPSAEAQPDGQLSLTVASFGGQTRTTATFQVMPWLSASFRYNAIQGWNLGGFATYYDRGFDVRFRLLKERRRWPAVTLGLQDFIGTGIYAAEYVVATKTLSLPGAARRLPGRLKLSAGLGWGRLGSSGGIGAPFGTVRPVFDPAGTGGEVAYDQWFRGSAAPFAGIEWRPDARWGLKAEYSPDAYTIETTRTSVFARRARFNFGVEYQATKRTRLGAYYLYGSELGLSAQIQLSPYDPPTALSMPAPQPIRPRPARAANPRAWDTGWAADAAAAPLLRDRLAPLLRADGLALESLDVTATAAELRFRNSRYLSAAAAVGRAARAMARAMPASVETFRLVPVSGGVALSAVTLRRSDLEALEYDPDAAAALLAVTGIGEAPRAGPGAAPARDLYPEFRWSLGPFVTPSYFDPDQPVRADIGADLRGAWLPAPGWILAGTIRHRLAGNIAQGRLSNSVLPRVRSDLVLYAQADTTMENLFAAYQWRPGRDLYARISAGYLETMFGGISAELLWKPVASPVGLGIEANYVRQRDYDQRFGFRDYRVATGAASVYADFGNGFEGQLDVGRYLAGDIGATFGLDRVFDNGWSVGGFFTLTDVSAADFGEGSFDKGIRFQIPLSWFLGQPGRQVIGTTIRPIQRDGGQRLRVPGRLYGQVREAHRKALRAQWARVWE